MEPEEIAVVLERASELHSKLSDAIAFVVEDAPPPPASSCSSSQYADGSAELSSLASIRDALEVLEDQLESLRALQQQQRAERDMGLAEIEESRRMLLKQLIDYRGKELEIIQEVLAFAGGSALDRDEVLPPSYPSLTDSGSLQAPPLNSIPNSRSSDRKRHDMHAFEAEAQDDDGNEKGSAYYDEEDPDNLIGAAVRAVNAVKSIVVQSGAISFALRAVKSSVALLSHLVGKISGPVTGPSSKVVLIVVSTCVVLSLTDVGEKRTKSVSRVSRMPAHQSHQHHQPVSGSCPPHGGQEGSIGPASMKPDLPQPVSRLSVQDETLAGDNAARIVDEFPNCVMRERLELPFYQELQTPDILHGRG